MEISKEEMDIITFLTARGSGASPEVVGVAMGQEWHQAHAWASPILARMVEKGILRKSNNGYYSPAKDWHDNNRSLEN